MLRLSVGSKYIKAVKMQLSDFYFCCSGTKKSPALRHGDFTLFHPFMIRNGFGRHFFVDVYSGSRFFALA